MGIVFAINTIPNLHNKAFPKDLESIILFSFFFLFFLSNTLHIDVCLFKACKKTKKGGGKKKGKFETVQDLLQRNHRAPRYRL